ncbi:MAG: hypothetical protein K0R09_229 [Clostridiales bacterium]|jgi:hypothetical protein|nr:hypothetical protein [Clostridiales bacterium]
MKAKKIFIISLIIMIITVVCMGINWFISPFSDIVIRIIGGIMLIDLFVLSYSTVKLKSKRN